MRMCVFDLNVILFAFYVYEYTKITDAQSIYAISIRITNNKLNS